MLWGLEHQAFFDCGRGGSRGEDVYIKQSLSTPLIRCIPAYVAKAHIIFPEGTDSVGCQVAPRMPKLKRFKGWIDGGWFFDAPTYSPDEFYFSPSRLSQWWYYTNNSFDG